ncbi:MAG UNVERIFIED_CONTAM: hypothetical protein LVT10_13115 [Anaerolineae bacterium]
MAGINLDEAFLLSLGQDRALSYQYPSLRPIDENFRALTILLGREFEVVMLLSVKDILASLRFGLIVIIAIAIITAGLSTTLGGVFIRRRIHPIWQLKDSAQRMGEGDLITPIIQVEELTPDISTLRDTLESSRQRIAKSLQEIQEQRDWVNALDAVDRRGDCNLSVWADRLSQPKYVPDHAVAQKQNWT